MPRNTSKSSTARGLGWKHRQTRDGLIRNHIDGNLCWWCGLPMFKEPTRNWDERVLAADHSVARALGGTRADRLLHWTCNAQRGDGSRDDQRPALTGRTARPKPLPATQREPLAMDW